MGESEGCLSFTTWEVKSQRDSELHHDSQTFFKNMFYFHLYVYCICVYITLCRYLWKPAGGVRSPVLGVTGDWLLWVHWHGTELGASRRTGSTLSCWASLFLDCSFLIPKWLLLLCTLGLPILSSYHRPQSVYFFPFPLSNYSKFFI